MSDPASVASLFAAAERAAIAGDFAAAARILGDAARVQEATLGPDHPELANTLNNLAVAHERSGQIDAAEREYRRAYAIAARRLPADHPQVATSAQNLREFCAANGRPFDSGVEPGVDSGVEPAIDSGVKPGLDSGVERAVESGVQAGAESGGERKTPPVERLAITFAADASPGTPPARGPAAAPRIPTPPPAEPRLRAAPDPAAPRAAPAPRAPAPADGAMARRRAWLPVLLALAALGVVLLWLMVRRGPAESPAPPAAAPEGSAPQAPPAATPDSRPATTAPSPGATPPPARPAARTPPSPEPAAPARGRTPAPPAPAPPEPAAGPAADGVRVGEARLCTTLAPGYRCTEARSPVRPGSLTFYTRVVATRPTSVVHRWYRGSELRQAVRLQVPPRRDGFRTYSRATVSPSPGEWRVELRARDGRLLHTETFTVR